jgi:hypothetical protein
MASVLTPILERLPGGRPLDVYLNDHLAGASFGSDLAERLAGRVKGPMLEVAEEIKEDRQTLLSLMDRLGTPRNLVKETMTWAAEKLSHLKLSGVTAGNREYGLFMALETLSLGVEGKASLWRALIDIAASYPELSAPELEQLHARAVRQREVIEAERFAAARRAFASGGS